MRFLKIIKQKVNFVTTHLGCPTTPTKPLDFPLDIIYNENER